MVREVDEKAFPTTQKKSLSELELKNPVALLPGGTAREQTAPDKTDTKTTGSTSAFPHPPSVGTPCSPALPRGQAQGVQASHSSSARYHLQSSPPSPHH